MIERIVGYYLIIFIFLSVVLGLMFLSPTYGYTFASLNSVEALPLTDSMRYLIEGVYYFINRGDMDAAEGMFRKAIMTNSFDGLQRWGDIAYDNDRMITAEAFYFLGRIYYIKSNLTTEKGYRLERNAPESNVTTIALARKYLEQAEEYGIIYDHIHPPLLDEINRKYPDIKAITSSTEPQGMGAKVFIETDDKKPYKLNAIKIDEYTDVTEQNFSTNKEFGLDGGTRYKIALDIYGSYSSIYKAMTIFGFGLMLWLIR